MLKSKDKILITGSAGFIGFHLSKLLLGNDYKVVGLDNLNSYYDVKLKKARNKILSKYKNYKFVKLDIKNKKFLLDLFKKEKIKVVINLAAQAGVQYSLKNPDAYISSNIVGFFNILEACKKFKIKKVFYASSSSIYGANKKIPFKESDKTESPLSLYAATKKSNEILANVYSHLFDLNLIGLRFFTVYGPFGRPDMSLFIFTKNILNKKKIVVYNKGNMYRDFTYVDDVVESIFYLMKNKKITKGHHIFNISGSRSVKLKRYISLIEKNLGFKAKIIYKPKLLADVCKTLSTNNFLKKTIKKNKFTSIEKGIEKFIKWYKTYYKNAK